MLSLYVHIPFCKTRCSYCDFYLVTRTGLIDKFFKALSLETASRSSSLKGQTIGAIHFGGGTPSIVPVRYLVEWINQIAALCCMAPDIEIALEANPEDLSHSAMDELRASGITRLSLGVQSFTPEKLLALKRAHTALESRQITALALKTFESVSVDLICGVPGEHLSLWNTDLQAVLALQPQHISVYMLSVEPKTLLHRNVVKGAITVPDDAVQASLYELALIELAKGGYIHYEVSNFCKPGHHSRYNLASWKREQYLGFGPSAHSFLVSEGKETRSANVSSLTRYIAHPEDAEGFCEVLTEDERYTEQVFLSLRINSGLDVEFLRKENKLGHRLSETITRFEQQGWIKQLEGRFYLTENGFLFADLIAGEFIFG
ncbi:MAG: radical SAM family heme chaperone HemW [Chlorobium sp.]|jgi:oxygen-independent coproporphyrinogen III oxidase|nr:MAG: radical SAM family heme chaperone HemW [Chlorobium sp.]